ncbi:MAG: TonB family protein [Acidobacteria bacterium]|nr:TonB family protein [Acidobacteriota bacterium]
MVDNSQQQGPDFHESETSTTQRLLKKDVARPDSDNATTAPLTGRMADLAQDKTEKKKSNTWLFVMIGAAVAVVVLVLVFMFVLPGESILSSGSTDINPSGSDSINATIVEGRPVPVARDAERATPTPTERRSRSADSGTVESTPDTGRPETTATSQPAPAAVRETPSRSTAEKPVEPSRSAASEPTPTQPAATSSPKTEPPPPAGGTGAESTSGSSATPATPAATPSASIQQGFDLKSQTQKSAVKTGDLVPLTGDVIRPVLKQDVTPEKPAIATRLRRSGRVILRILIDESGNVIDAKVVNENPTNLGFGEAAVTAAKKRKYTPATKDNVRVKVWETLVFTFR